MINYSNKDILEKICIAMLSKLYRRKINIKACDLFAANSSGCKWEEGRKKFVATLMCREAVA